MIRSEETRIDGNRYTVTTVGTFEGIQLSIDIAKMVAPGFAEGEPIDIAQLFEKEVETLLPALARIVSKLDPVQLRGVLSVLAQNTQVKTADGTIATLDQVFDLHFTGELPTMLKWLVFALRVNFGNFFAASKTSDSVIAFGAKQAKTEAATA